MSAPTLLPPSKRSLRTDPVDRLVADSTPEEFVAWMVKYHGLPESAVETVTSNLREQFHWQRLRGRLDRWPAWAALAELLLRRPKAPTPQADQANVAGSEMEGGKG